MKLIREIAERQAINKFTTAEVKIDMTGMTNKIESGEDIDGFLSQFTVKLEDALYATAEGCMCDVLFFIWGNPFAGGAGKDDRQNRREKPGGDPHQRGEINLLKTPGAHRVQIQRPAAKRFLSLCRVPGGVPAQSIWTRWSSWRLGKSPSGSRVLRYHGGTEVDWQTDVKASLEDYTIEESADNGVDFRVELQLKRYRDWGTKVLQIKDRSATEKPQRDPEAIKPKGKGIHHPGRGYRFGALPKGSWGRHEVPPGLRGQQKVLDDRPPGGHGK